MSRRNWPCKDQNDMVFYSTYLFNSIYDYMGMGQNLVPLVNLKIAGKWMFIPLKMVLIGIDPYPYNHLESKSHENFGFRIA